MYRFLTLFTICTILIFIVLLMGRCAGNDTHEKKIDQAGNVYIGDKQCQSCHTSEYNDWLKSDHFKAMLDPDDSTVLGDFNNVSYTADGVTSRFFKQDGKFIINTQGEDGKNHDYEVKYTFGYFPLQQYLIAFPGGRMQATRVSWDSRQNKWFHQNAGQKIDSHDWLHWTGNAQNWNTMCAECHSTDLKKNYDIQSDSYHTTYSVINVSCEACHGPGKLHVDYVNSNDYKEGIKTKKSFLLLDSGSSQLTQINTCAPCHSVKTNISANKINSGELLDDYIPVVPTTERYYADGQIREEDYEYASFLQSKMFRQGVTCSNCHNPHSGKRYYMTNQLCLQCHSKTYDDPTHTFHAINTAGAECKSCHMPEKTYMGNDLRRDHSFRVPRPDLSVRYATPNSCNNCHKNKTAQWAADAVVKWYGPKRKYHFAEDLIPGSEGNANSEAHLTKLLGDTSVPPIIKATALNYLGDISTQSSLNTLLHYLKNEDAQVRYEALKSLRNFSPAQYVNELAPLLSDKVRAVRIAAADLFIDIPKQNIPSQYANSFSIASSELNRFVLYQADYAHGNISIGDYYMRLNDLKNAEKFYLRALQKDSLANLTRLNLATLYNTEGKNEEAVNVLESAKKVDNKNPEIFYNLALLHNEMNNQSAAIHNFEQAYNLHPANPRLFYNYGLLLQKSGNNSKAINVLETGLKVDKNSAALNYALAYVYFQDKQVSKARQYGLILKRLEPNNPDYQQFFSVLGIN